MGRFVRAFLDLSFGAVEGIVAAELHLVVEEVGSAVETGHIGGCNSVASAPAALSTAHSAAAHIAHHRACEVVESAVVGIVGVENSAYLVVFVEIAHEAAGLPAPVAGDIGRRDVVAGAAEDVAEHALHHSGLDAEIEDSFLLAVVNSRKFSLVGLLLDNLEFIDNLSGKVLGSDLGVVQEEGLSVDGDLSDFLTVVGDSSVFGNLHSGDFLQKVLEHIVVCTLEGRGGKGDSVALHLDRVSAVGDLRGFQLGSVGTHLDFSEVEICVFDFDVFLVFLVAEEFRTEDVFTVLYSGKGYFTVFFAELVCNSLVVCGIVERDSSETDCFSGLRIFENGLYLIGLRVRGNACEKQEKCCFKVQIHNLLVGVTTLPCQGFP